MGSGASHVDHRQVAVTNDYDRQGEVSNQKLSLEIDANLPVDMSTPHSSHRNRGGDQSDAPEGLLMSNTPLHSLQNRGQLEMNGTIMSTTTVSGSATYSRSSHRSPYATSGDGREPSDMINVDAVDENDREMLEHTAMSLGMDYDEFLFNVLYFGDGQVPNLSAAISNAREETVALHSENNTPYKLRPASTAAIDGLKSEALHDLNDLDEPDCAICKENMEINNEVIFLPSCRHCFHMDCLVRWIKLQGFCPVCRTVIGKKIDDISSKSNGSSPLVYLSSLPPIDDENEEEYNITRNILSYSEDNNDSYVRSLFQTKDKSFNTKEDENEIDSASENDSIDKERKLDHEMYSPRSTGSIHSFVMNNSKCKEDTLMNNDDISDSKESYESLRESRIVSVHDKKIKKISAEEKDKMQIEIRIKTEIEMEHRKDHVNIVRDYEEKDSDLRLERSKVKSINHNDIDDNKIKNSYLSCKKKDSNHEYDSDIKNKLYVSSPSSTPASPFTSLSSSVLVDYYTSVALESQTKSTL